MMKITELDYAGCMIIADQIEILITDTKNEQDKMVDVKTLADDYLDFVEKDGKYIDWLDCEIYPMCTVDTYRPSNGVKFVFTRLISGKNSKDSPRMGGGTQWVSDTIDLMKNFLAYLRQLDVRNNTALFFDARLIFRIDGKQFEWR